MQFGQYDFRTFRFGSGSHETREDGMCVMEAVAYVAGEQHSDAPQCASPVISAFMRSWNDGLPSDEERNRLLSQFVFRLPGTKAPADIELQRSWMCFDWLVRECAAEFMSLSPSLATHANVLRGLPEINATNVDVVVPVIQAAGAAARAAAGAAARAAAGAAAWDAAWAAAWDAAWEKISPSIARLQASAVNLVDRMIRLTEISEGDLPKWIVDQAAVGV